MKRAALIILCAFGLPACAQRTPRPSPQQEAAMTTRAAGPFDVKLTPMPPDEGAADSGIGRMSLDKQFHGALEASSKGQMLAVRSPVDGSAGYVAMERVSGTLEGRKGTFALQHSGTMTRGAPTLSVTVVPDSGTGELTGLTGRMDIVIEGGKHSYVFEYTLPPRP
jgi:hypothetical protein